MQYEALGHLSKHSTWLVEALASCIQYNAVLLLGRRTHLQLMVQHIAAVVYYQGPQDTLHNNCIVGRHKAADG